MKNYIKKHPTLQAILFVMMIATLTGLTLLPCAFVYVK